MEIIFDRPKLKDWLSPHSSPYQVGRDISNRYSFHQLMDREPPSYHPRLSTGVSLRESHMGPPKSHHFVPRSYLARFDDNDGFCYVSCLHCIGLSVSPDAGKGVLDLLLEAVNQLAVGVDQRLLGFDLGDDCFLDFERWQRNWKLFESHDG